MFSIKARLPLPCPLTVRRHYSAFSALRRRIWNRGGDGVGRPFVRGHWQELALRIGRGCSRQADPPDGVPNAEPALSGWWTRLRSTRRPVVVESAGWCGRVVAEVVLAISHTGAPRQTAPNAGKLRRGDSGRVRTARMPFWQADRSREAHERFIRSDRGAAPQVLASGDAVSIAEVLAPGDGLAQKTGARLFGERC